MNLNDKTPIFRDGVYVGIELSISAIDKLIKRNKEDYECGYINYATYLDNSNAFYRAIEGIKKEREEQLR